MRITNLYVADCHMKWNGINLEPSDLYGHDEFYGLIYSHAPASGSFVFFNRIDVDEDVIACRISELPDVDNWETDDGRVYFEAVNAQPEEYFPVVITTVDGWDVDLVEELLEECSPDEEVAMYVDGDEVTFFIRPVYSSPDVNQYGECIETWYA